MSKLRNEKFEIIVNQQPGSGYKASTKVGALLFVLF